MTSKTEQLRQLEKAYHNCTRCPLLVKNRTQVVFGVGDPNKCKVVIIGEAPGKQEDMQGEPFVGKSGQLLNEFLEHIGLTRKEVYITNTILCRPPHNRNPSSEELCNCRNRLNHHITILDPKVIITLGNFATQYLLETKQGITKLRGKPVHTHGRTIIPMQHPAVLLYHGNSPEKRKEFEDDFAAVQNILETQPKETQQKLTS